MIGISCAPGKQDPLRFGADLDQIASWGAGLVVTLLELHEMEALGIARLGEEIGRRRMDWQHWPIQDFAVPDAVFEAAWPARSSRLRSRLARSGRVLIHCRGGLGRSGMVSARLLVDMGESAPDALAAVRSVRPGAVETAEQERWAAGQPGAVRGVAGS